MTHRGGETQAPNRNNRVADMIGMLPSVFATLATDETSS
jgi:hypothetical protein